MKICQEHWDKLRDAVDEAGMGHLRIKDDKEAFDHVVNQAAGKEVKFDPLMMAHNVVSGHALKVFGLAIAHKHDRGTNDGHWCPLCVAKTEGDAWQNPNLDKEWIDGTVNGVKEYADKRGLLNVN